MAAEGIKARCPADQIQPPLPDSLGAYDRCRRQRSITITTDDGRRRGAVVQFGTDQFTAMLRITDALWVRTCVVPRADSATGYHPEALSPSCVQATTRDLEDSARA